MKPIAITKAKIRLLAARAALARMPGANNANQFAAEWYSFITSAKNVYTVLETGAKSNPRSRQWVGGKHAFRRKDPLLQYLYQARDDDEHGLDIPLTKTVAVSHLGIAGSGNSNHVRIRGPNLDIVCKGFGVAGYIEGRHHNPANHTVESLDGLPVANHIQLPRIILRPVTDRGRNVYHPPKTHLGKTLDDDSPISVARCGLGYLEEMVREAEQLA